MLTLVKPDDIIIRCNICECAGIGRQARLRGVCPRRTGSSPVTRTSVAGIKTDSGNNYIEKTNICGRGGIGRRVCFRRIWMYFYAGSSPVARTNKEHTFVYQKCVLCLSKPQAWYIIRRMAVSHHGNAVYCSPAA